MKHKLTALTAMALAAGSLAFANTPLLVNTNFAGFGGWIIGANRFQPKTTWLEFVSAPSAFSYESRVQPSGAGFVFHSWDDGVADRIETYLFQEFGAGPAASTTPSIFQTGDVIVFKGSARATRVGANTADMTVRAFIKVLGYNELGWAFQTKHQYSAFHNIGAALEPFELSVTFPNLAVDDSLQVLQIGFEISTEYDGTAMDSGTIYFENIEAYIVGEAGGWRALSLADRRLLWAGAVRGFGAGCPPATWLGYAVDANGYADTGAWLGWVNVSAAPWIWIVKLNAWAYLPEAGAGESGGWAFIVGH